MDSDPIPSAPPLVGGSDDITKEVARRNLAELGVPVSSPSMHNAANKGSVMVVRYLHALGIGVGGGVLHDAARSTSPDAASVITWLCYFGADVNGTAGLGYTALHVAAKHGRTTCVSTLLAHGADPNIQDRQGNTSLHIAASSSVARLLLKSPSTRIEILNHNNCVADVSQHMPFFVRCEALVKGYVHSPGFLALVVFNVVVNIFYVLLFETRPPRFFLVLLAIKVCLLLGCW